MFINDLGVKMTAFRLVGVDVYDNRCIEFLYEMLLERTPEQSISHKAMPTFIYHKLFVQSMPYESWSIISACIGYDNFEMVGNIYVTKDSEVGIFIKNSWQGRGFGEAAIRQIIESRGKLRPLYANINPNNHVSIDFFKKKFNAKHIQNTYLIEI